MMTPRRLTYPATFLLALGVLAAGCAKKNQTASTGTSSDSLLASSPVEQPQGQVQPQSGFQPQQQTQAPPEPAPVTPHTTRHRTRPEGGGGGGSSAAPAAPAERAGVTVAAGTGVKVTVGTKLSSENATVGQSWTGSVKEAVTVGSAAPFPAGSVVNGVVEAVKPAAKGDRALLVLRITSIQTNGVTHDISATSDSMIAGSTRARNVGAIAGGAAAGALIGRAVGGSGKGALIGGLLGAGAATGGVAASKGYQVVVNEGQEISFHVDRDTHVRL